MKSPKSLNNLKKGNPGNRGGGRPKEEFLEWCRNLANSPEARKFIESLVKGEPIEEKVLDTPGGTPQKLLVSASPETRRKALADLWDRGYGKAPQGVELSGKVDLGAEAAKQQIAEETRKFLKELAGA